MFVFQQILSDSSINSNVLGRFDSAMTTVREILPILNNILEYYSSPIPNFLLPVAAYFLFGLVWKLSGGILFGVFGFRSISPSIS